MVKPDLPIYLNVPKYVTGLNSEYKGDTKVLVHKGKCRDSTGTNDISLAEDVLIDASKNGAGGLDFGSLAQISLYRVHVIGSSTDKQPPSALVSLLDIPILPAGYDMFRRVGYVSTYAVINPGDTVKFICWYQYGVGLNKTYYKSSSLLVSNAQNVAAFTELPLGVSIGSVPDLIAVPPTASFAMLHVYFDPVEGARFFPAPPLLPVESKTGSVLFSTGAAPAQSTYSFSVPVKNKDGVATVYFGPLEYSPGIINGKFSSVYVSGFVDRLID